MKRCVAVFDFDGTLTRCDTLPRFILFACGPWRCCAGFLLLSPILVLMKLRLYPNWKAKQRLFSFFFRGMAHERFAGLGIRFAEVAGRFRRKEATDLLQQYVASGATVYVISASMEEWVRPWCQRLGVKDVLCTKVEVGGDGRLTGRLKTPNCYGQEKVRRLLEAEPQRQGYTLHAYGDSRGDREMIAFADKGCYVKDICRSQFLSTHLGGGPRSPRSNTLMQPGATDGPSLWAK